MLFEEYRKLLWLYVYVCTMTLLHVETRKEKTCPTYIWRLSGGRRDFEGTIEVKYKDKWFNVCSENVPSAKVCSGRKISGDPVVHNKNVFKSSLKKKAMHFENECNPEREKLCKTEEDNECCQPAGICCLDYTLGDHCSENWTGIYSAECHYKRYGSRVTYSETRVIDFAEIDKNISWTRSALGVFKENCSMNDSLDRDLVKQCTNDCLKGNNFTKVYVTSKGDCKCIGNDFSPQSGNGCYKVLYIVNNNTRPVDLCIAAEVVNGTKAFTAEECDRFLQPFCVKSEETKPDISFTVTNANFNEQVHTNQSRDDVESESEDVMMSTIIVFTALILVAFLICCLYKCSRKSKRKDPLRPNSLYNRTYDRQMPKNDEEYAIISEIELDSGATIYKPPLPDRGTSSQGAGPYNIINSNKDTPSAAIITLDDYSTPSDVIRDKSDVDLAVEYSTTYDDPIRHNTENIAEIKRQSDTNIDKRSSKNSISRNTENVNPQSYGCILNPGKENNFDKSGTSNCGDPAEKEESNTSDFARTRDPENSEDIPSALIQSCMTNADDSHEYFTLSKTDVPCAVTNVADYEDTNIIDGNFPTRPTKGFFEEHVCLHCLKPDHLKKLGIKLINEKQIDKLEKRFSEPAPKTNSTAKETCRNLRRCKTDTAETEAQNDLLTFIEDISMVENTRKCVECNNEYDRLGHVKVTAQAEYIRNEYHRMSDVHKTNM